MALTLYYSPMSSAARCLWALEELGIPYEKVRLHLDKLDQKRPEYLALNPNGKVPALVDGEVKMFESIAIMIYLGEKYGVAKGLWPKADTAERAQALSWLVWSSAELQAPIVTYVMHTGDRSFSFPKEQRHAPSVEMAKKQFDMMMRVLDGHLEGKEYVAGSAFSFADLAIFGTLGFATMMAGLSIEPYKHVNEWFGRIRTRPAFARAMSIQ